VTVANNTTQVNVGPIGVLGGGLYDTGRALITYSVVRANFALNNAGNGNSAGGGVFNAAGTVTVRRSLINRNVPDNCAPPNTIAGCTG
jgi:hypothetical protein